MKICGLIWRRQPAALAVVVKLAAARREVSVEDLKFEVFEFHEHRLASMNLQRHEPPADLPGIVVDELQRLVAVDPGADVIALRDNGVIVPILIFVVTNREEHLGIGELGDHAALARRIKDDKFADPPEVPSRAISVASAAAMLVEHETGSDAGIGAVVRDLRLIARHLPITKVPASKLDARVSLRHDPKAELEDEIRRFLPA